MTMTPLRLVHAEAGGDAQARVEFAVGVEGDQLVARFRVSGARPAHVNPALAAEGPQWGLWDWDVVELFVSPGGPAPYYEFQVSPLGQYFELEILEPRRRWDRAYRSGLTWDADRAGEGEWAATMRIPLRRIGITGEGALRWLRGNAFAILGAPGSRTYWSLHTPPQSVPDFHRPEHFRALLPDAGSSP